LSSTALTVGKPLPDNTQSPRNQTFIAGKLLIRLC